MSAIIRLRAPLIPDPRNSRRQIQDWSGLPDQLEVGGWVDVVASQSPDQAGRDQAVGTATLYCNDPDADVQLHDRVVYHGSVWTVEGFPDSPSSPFTGWRPYRIVALKLVVG